MKAISDDLLARARQFMDHYCWCDYRAAKSKCNCGMADTRDAIDRLRASPSQEKAGEGCDHDWLPAFGYCSRCGIAHPTPDADAVAPVARDWWLLTLSNGIQLRIVRDGEHFKIDPNWVEVNGPAPTVATREAVSDAMVDAALRVYAMEKDQAVWPDAYGADEVAMERKDMRLAIEAAFALAAPPTVRAGDEG